MDRNECIEDPAQESLQPVQREKGRCRYPYSVLFRLVLTSGSATETDHAAIAAEEGKDAYTVGGVSRLISNLLLYTDFMVERRILVAAAARRGVEGRVEEEMFRAG